MQHVSFVAGGLDKRAGKPSPSSRSKLRSRLRTRRSAPLRVLLASGNPDERAAWRTMLNNPRYALSEAENGVAALSAIISEEADIIIAAVTMERVDALQLLRAAQDLESPPIVVVAQGHSEINHVYLRAAKLLGAAATYLQPFDVAEFANGINAALSARKSRSSRS